MQLDMQKLKPLLENVVRDVGGAANAALVQVGTKLGLYAALGIEVPTTPAELAAKTGTHERYVREWLSAQAASGFITLDRKTEKFLLTAEQAAVFADRGSPVYQAEAFASLTAVYADEPRLTEAFRRGRGLGWDKRNGCLYCGTEWAFRPGYKSDLVESWLPSLDGVVAKLERGGKVADVGCGHGASTIFMAEAFPKSEFIGFDFHDGSVEHAREHVNGHRNVRFAVARAESYEGTGYDLVTLFDCLHDMGDPVGVARHIRKTLKPDGALMVVEPLAGDSIADNMNPIGRMYYAYSTNLCIPASLDQDVGTALGAQAGEKRLTEVLREAGFTKVRRTAETPVSMVLEARP